MTVLNKEEEKAFRKYVTNEDCIQKESSLSWDGSNLIVRIPKEMAEYLDLTEKNRFTKSILFKIKEKEGQIIKTFEVIDRTKQRKIRKEKHDKQKTTK
ncbi:MAG: hypothetical protein AABX11_01560 [Nanoarchaeota archaeon]